jgi:hypothetical protein
MESRGPLNEGDQHMVKPDWLYIELERSGGQVPTFRPRFRIDIKGVSEEDLKTVDHLLSKVDLFHQPDRFPRTGHPDTFEYHLTIGSAEESHTIVFHDEDGHPKSLDALVDWIRDYQSR